jgi:hypothetical protein
MKEVVWSVNILLGVGMIGVSYLIFKILQLAHQEENVSVQNKEDQQGH